MNSSERLLPNDSDIAAEVFRPIYWRAASDIQFRDKIKTGDVIMGFRNAAELDIFVTNLGRYLMWDSPVFELPPTHIASSGKPFYEGWHVNAKPPSRALISRKTVGTLTNMRVLMLEDELLHPELTTSRIPAIKRFIATANVYVRGKGIQGNVALQGNVRDIIYNTFLKPDAPKIPYGISITYKNIPKGNPEAVARAIINDSNKAYESVLRRGLRHTILVAPPGSGKRR